jgi:hypothetical protein
MTLLHGVIYLFIYLVVVEKQQYSPRAELVEIVGMTSPMRFDSL